MADYRELLRKAIDALPDNTGANRRAVYEKARSALVAQLRAIEPPLPAREITTHRLNLEDCIREVEHEATEKLLGRFRAVENEPESEPEIVPAVEAEPEPEEAFPEAVEPEADIEDEAEPDVFEAPPAEGLEPEADGDPFGDAAPEVEPVAVAPDWTEDEAALADEDDRFEAAPEIEDFPDTDEPDAGTPALEDEHPPAPEPAPYQPGSIEDI